MQECKRRIVNLALSASGCGRDSDEEDLGEGLGCSSDL